MRRGYGRVPMSNLDYIRWLRGQVGSTKVILVYASAVIPDDRGRVLLQRRSDFDWWGLPGGVIELGESLGECLVREVREETGLDVAGERLVGVYSSPDFDVVYPNGDQVQQFTACFTCRVLGGSRRPDGEEVLGLEFFHPERLPDVPIWYRAMIEDFAAGREEASFRQGRAGGPLSDGHVLQLRESVGNEPLTMVGASAHVSNEAGEVLLVRRSDDGAWGLPAGAMELGERVDRTIVREMREETGLLVEPEWVVGVYSGEGFFHTYPNGHQVHIVSTHFACRVGGGTLQPDGREIVEASFFDPQHLPPLHSRHKMRIEDVLLGRRRAVWR
jgi:ADP-ribose pyrophosphatase YjhB (NUDIX family)